MVSDKGPERDVMSPCLHMISPRLDPVPAICFSRWYFCLFVFPQRHPVCTSCSGKADQKAMHHDALKLCCLSVVVVATCVFGLIFPVSAEQQFLSPPYKIEHGHQLLFFCTGSSACKEKRKKTKNTTEILSASVTIAVCSLCVSLLF